MRELSGLHSRLSATLLVVTFGAAGVTAQETRPRPAVPVEPISAILDAFEQHAIVALGDPHGNEQAHAFRLSLIRNPRFAAAVDDIVVEWGNALYQDVMDQFVRGDDVSDAELRKVWQNTTQPGQGNDRPITEGFFRAVREVNASLRPERRLRVLLGDPSIDWDAVESPADHQEWLRLRDTHPAALTRREVLEPDRRALVIYGGIHLQRRNLLSNYELVADPAPPHARPAARAGGRHACVHRLAGRGGGPAGAAAGRGVMAGSQPCDSARHGARGGGLHRVLRGARAPRDDSGGPHRTDSS